MYLKKSNIYEIFIIFNKYDNNIKDKTKIK